MRILASFLALLALSGCLNGKSGYEEPLPRATYQKVIATPYVGASSEPGAPAATARGSSYQSGSVSSAGADWARWPAGTLFRVLATGDLYEVDDFTDDIVGKNSILLFQPSSTPANSTPHQVTIEIVRWGSPHDSAAMLRAQKSSTSKKILVELLQRYPEAR